MKKTKVLVTGGTGYVGKQIVTALKKSETLDVFSAGRSSGDYIGDLREASFVQKILKDIDIIIHSAALTRSNSPQTLAEHNEEVLSSIITLIKKSKRPVKVIFLSTDLAVGPIGAYGKSKRNCEDLLAKSGLDYLILRMGPVLGDYSPLKNSTYSKLVKSVLKRKLLILPGGGQFQVQTTYIVDLISILKIAIYENKIEKELISIYDSKIKVSDFLKLVSFRSKRPLKILSLPLSPLKFIASFLAATKLFSFLPLETIINIGLDKPTNKSDNFPSPHEADLETITSQMLNQAISSEV